MKILFVCTGNTCRSPMAESIAKSLSNEHEFASRGVSAFDGAPTSAHTKSVIAQYHLATVGNATMFTADDTKYDLILTMTNAHKNFIKTMYPNDNTFTLIEYVEGTSRDVSDPYGGSYDVYEQTYHELKRYIEMLLSKLNSMA